MRAVFAKGERGFFPNNEEAEALFTKVKHGEQVMVEYIKTRNYQNHKRFFALVNVTFEIQDVFTDKEIWRKALELMAGHYDTVITPLPKDKERLFLYLDKYLGGNRKEDVIKAIENSYKVNLVPRSISFSEMDETEFNELFERTITAFIENYGNGLTEAELYEVLDFV